MHKFSSNQETALCNIPRCLSIYIERKFLIVLTTIHVSISRCIDHDIRIDHLYGFKNQIPVSNINITMFQRNSIRKNTAKVRAKHPTGAENQCFNFSHHHRLSTYHLAVSLSPSLKSYSGAQPSSINLEQSSEYL